MYKIKLLSDVCFVTKLFLNTASDNFSEIFSFLELFINLNLIHSKEVFILYLNYPRISVSIELFLM